MAWTRAFGEAIRPYSIGRVYVNFLRDGGSDRLRAAYGEARYERRRLLTQKNDATNLFRLNQTRPEQDPGAAAAGSCAARAAITHSSRQTR